MPTRKGGEQMPPVTPAETPCYSFSMVGASECGIQDQEVWRLHRNHNHKVTLTRPNLPHARDVDEEVHGQQLIEGNVGAIQTREAVLPKLPRRGAMQTCNRPWGIASRRSKTAGLDRAYGAPPTPQRPRLGTAEAASITTRTASTLSMSASHGPSPEKPPHAEPLHRTDCQ